MWICAPSYVFSSLAINLLLLAIFSGVIYNNFKPDFLSTIACCTALTSSLEQVEFKNVLSIFSSFRAMSWSSIKEISGETTRVIPFEITAGNWKHKLFPPPVGIIKIQSEPDIVAFIHSNCRGRKDLILKVFFRAASTFSDQEKFFADHSILFSFFCEQLGSRGTSWLQICDWINSFWDWRNCCLSSKVSICVSICLSSWSISSSSLDSSITSDKTKNYTRTRTETNDYYQVHHMCSSAMLDFY